MDYKDSSLGQILRQLRYGIDKTLHYVSSKIDIDSPLLSKIERGKRLPTPSQLEMLCKFYGISEKELKIKYTAEKILREYGKSQETFQAIQFVREELQLYLIKPKKPDNEEAT